MRPSSSSSSSSPGREEVEGMEMLLETKTTLEGEGLHGEGLDGLEWVDRWVGGWGGGGVRGSAAGDEDDIGGREPPWRGFGWSGWGKGR